MCRRGFATVIIIIALAANLFADQITLKNGDGTIAKADGKTLTVKTESMGDVTCATRTT